MPFLKKLLPNFFTILKKCFFPLWTLQANLLTENKNTILLSSMLTYSIVNVLLDKKSLKLTGQTLEPLRFTLDAIKA